MLLAMNGTASSSHRTRHINIRYFFVADRVASGEVKIEYCPTAQMLAGDYFTKPLQGNLFRTMRNLIMNINPTSDHTYAMQDYRSMLNMLCNGHVGNGHTNYTDTDNGCTNHASAQTNEKTGLQLNQGRSGLEIECLVPAKLAHFNLIIWFYKQYLPSVLFSSDLLFHGHEDVLRTL
jgi:hypothetical protein